MSKKMTHTGTVTGVTMYTVKLRKTKKGWVSKGGIVYNKRTGYPAGPNPNFRLDVRSVRRIK